MDSGRFGIFVLIGLAIVVGGLALFTVNERELAIKLRVGEVVTAEYEPGLHWKWPILETVQKFPKRILTISDRPERVFTAENESLDVDFFVKYRIVDSVRFYTSTGGVRDVADQRLGEIVKNAVVTEFGKRTVSEAISVGRAELMRDLLVTAAPTAKDLGVELIDFRVKQVEFMEDVRNSVYAQMEAERARIASQRRSEGRAIEREKRAQADRERTVILANAYRDGEIIRGEGDASAAEVYANAYTKDAEFYAFYRSIDAYKRSMGKPGDLLVLDPNNEFFRYLNQSDGSQ
ncbi:MAG: protease modulator HflC [Gammaproteobacteria bacterium]|nr:protease modulator HflC [Gammaproteobacteria bacterium]